MSIEENKNVRFRGLKEEGVIVSAVISGLDFERNKYSELMNKLTDEFINMQLYEGDKLLEYAKDNNITLEDYILFNHSAGASILKFSSNSYNNLGADAYPLIQVSAQSDFVGWSFDLGCYSDVYMDVKDGKLLFNTRNIFLNHTLYIHWILTELEKRYNEYKMEGDYSVEHSDYLKIFDKRIIISREFNDYISKNKSVKINTLQQDGVYIKDYIKANLSNYFVSPTSIFKCCYIYRKPYSQVKKYMKQILK